MAKPLIGISGRRWPASVLADLVPPALRDVTFDLHFSDYPRAVAAAGGLPVELARDGDPGDLVDRLDGLVLSGGADVDPRIYGAEPDPQLGATERERDEWELALFAAARERSVPVLAICRGFQLVNVALGGSLRQHVEIDEGVGHPQWDVDGRTATHDVHVRANTVTATLLPADWAVNSLHHQTVERLADGLIVSATAADGVIEGFETPDGAVLAVQWHPELLAAPDPTFEWLVRSATRRPATEIRN
jgi:putative glutamine amidotransferase